MVMFDTIHEHNTVWLKNFYEQYKSEFEEGEQVYGLAFSLKFNRFSAKTSIKVSQLNLNNFMLTWTNSYKLISLLSNIKLNSKI